LGTLSGSRTAFVKYIRGLDWGLSNPEFLRSIAQSSILLLTYVVSGKIGHALAWDGSGVTAFWAPSGIALAALLILGPRFWPVIFLAAFLGNVTLPSHGVFVSLVIALGNTLEGLVGAYLVFRCANGTKAFFQTKNVARFILLACVLATAISATIGVNILCYTGIASWNSFASLWATWWEGDALASIVLAPFLILLLGNPHHSLNALELTELVILITGLAAVSIQVFGPPGVQPSAVIYLCIPFTLWAAFRFCPLEAAGANLILCGFAMWGSLTGYGPFANATDTPLALGLFVGVITSMTLFVASSQFQHRGLEEDLIVAAGTYKHALNSLETDFQEHFSVRRALEEDQRALREIARKVPHVIWVLDRVNKRALYVNPDYEEALSRSWERLCNNPGQWVGSIKAKNFESPQSVFDSVGSFTNGKLFQTHYRTVGPDGSQTWVHRVRYPVCSESTEPRHFEDISIEVRDSQCTEKIGDQDLISPQCPLPSDPYQKGSVYKVSLADLSSNETPLEERTKTRKGKPSCTNG
jgi:integral membrane sensor domain MASE1